MSHAHEPCAGQIKKKKQTLGHIFLPSAPAAVQRLVLDHPVNVRLGVSGGLAVQDGGVTLVHGRVLRLHLEVNVHCTCRGTGA